MAIARKLKTVITNPAKLRNYIYGKINYWPVHRIDHPQLVDLPTYCISLPAAQRRRKLMAHQARKAGLTGFRFVEAVDGRDYGIRYFTERGDYDPVEAKRYHESGLTVGEIATTLSHGEAYEAIVLAGHARALILEDDALFVSRRLARVDFNDVPDDCDVLFLNSFLQHEPPHGHVAGSVYETRSWYGSSAAYILTQDAARKLAGIYRPVIHACDGLLGRNLTAFDGDDHAFRQRGARTSLNSYLIHPVPILNGSTVHFTGTLLDT